MTIQKAPVTANMFFDLKLLAHFLEDNSSGSLITRAKKMINEDVIAEIKIGED